MKQPAQGVFLHRRHNAIRNLVVDLGRRAGTSAAIEQHMLWQLEGAEPQAPRPIHTADAHLIDESANSIYVDTRCTNRPVGKDLQQ